VIAQFDRPVLLSGGKDSITLVFSSKAFFPSKIPFPLHVDTGHFPETIEFRDRLVKN
jgi:3'-phosphoadenosine 5'-phosphosulfate sulfotransferase (PAPS reductase)/FAD synthetase